MKIETWRPYGDGPRCWEVRYHGVLIGKGAYPGTREGMWREIRGVIWATVHTPF